jgi:hypothetical protein
MKSFLLATLVTAITVGYGIAAPRSSASAPAVVNVAPCAFGTGTTTVPAAVAITIHSPGFAEGTLGLVNDFLGKQRTSLTVTGATTLALDLSGAWGAPQQLDHKLWVTRPADTPLGVALAPGETLVVTFDIVFKHPMLVAFPPVGPTGDNGPFLTGEEGPLACAITAAS